MSSGSPYTEIFEFDLLKPGDLVVMCSRYREYMNDPRTGAAGLLSYVDPGPLPGIVIDTCVFNERTTSQVLWPDGRVFVVENQFLREAPAENE